MKKSISILIKPASSLCNLRCKYCFYANISAMREVKNYGRMKPAIVDALIKNVYADLENGDDLSITFQGGEPTLAGLRYFEYFISIIDAQIKQVKVHYALQTNGTMINDTWCAFLKSYEFLVGLSIDGTPLYHDLNRIDLHGNGTFHHVMETKRRFDRYQINYNVLCVLTNPLAKHAKKVFDFLSQNNINYVQFIPCLDDFGVNHRSNFALTPNRFFNFYQTYFTYWFKQLQNGEYQSVKLFDDIINQFAHKRRTACGLDGQCQIQYIIEADGSVYPCDFYALDQYRLGYIQEKTLRQLFSEHIALDFMHTKRMLPTMCATCPFKQYCCGGCKRMKDAMYVNSDGDFCGYRSVLEIILPHTEEILYWTQLSHFKYTSLNSALPGKDFP